MSNSRTPPKKRKKNSISYTEDQRIEQQKINIPNAPSFCLPVFPMEEDPTRLLAVPIGFELLCSDFFSRAFYNCAKSISHALTARPRALFDRFVDC